MLFCKSMIIISLAICMGLGSVAYSSPFIEHDGTQQSRLLRPLFPQMQSLPSRRDDFIFKQKTAGDRLQKRLNSGCL